MKIVVLRHGSPVVKKSGNLNALNFGRWIEAYNESEVDASSLPSIDVVKQAQSCSFVVCSDYSRAVGSAQLLDANIDVRDSMFRECDMPHARWRWPRLPVSAWLFYFRFSQLLGYSPNAESITQAKHRASACALQLQKWAEEHNSVLFVGHGWLNGLIVHELRRMGWKGSRPGRNYWQYGVYHRDGETL